MERGRPYASSDALFDRVDEAFDTLAREDWLQAFAAHAQIGAPRAADERGAKEQAGDAILTLVKRDENGGHSGGMECSEIRRQRTLVIG